VIAIRTATTADAAPLAVFARRCFDETFAAYNTREDMEAYLSSAFGERQQHAEITDPEWITLLAEEGRTMAGFAQIKLEPESIEIHRFYVDRTFHGRGVAQSLMAESEAIAAARAAKRIWLGVWERNDRAIAFYKKCGFRDCGSQQFILGTDVQTDRVMEKVFTAEAQRAQRPSATSAPLR
jgi:diamine N-acetyltransferase